MKQKSVYLNLCLIFLIGVLIRLVSVDKAEGLWNDEYISWYISTRSLFTDFIKAVFQNCHMPLYYCYLKTWTFLFGNSDTVLRISSVIPGCLSIITMFFVGKELKDDNTGLYCAAITAVSGFMIYFSQEVRFYSLLFLFSSLALLYMLKLVEKQELKNYIGFYIFNVLIMFVHTIGFVFVFFNFLVLFGYLKKENRITNKTILYIVGASIVAMLPFVPFLYKTMTASYISQFWSDFSFTKLFFVFADYVSPIQINLINTPIHVSTLLLRSGKFNWGYFVFAIIPLFIACVGILTAFLKRTTKLKLISLSAIATLLVMIIASLSGKLVLITKYTTEIYPVFIAVTAFGFYCVRPESVRKFLSAAFFGIIILYVFTSEYAPQRLKRPEGHKLAADLVREAKLAPNDKILLLYYDKERFGKYMRVNDFDIDAVTKYNFQYKLLHNPPSHYEVVKNGKELFKDSFQSNENEYLRLFLREKFFDNMKKGDKFAIITLNSVAFIDKERMQTVMADKSFYERMPFLFLIFSHISNITQTEADKVLKPVYNDKKGKWSIFVWEKV